MFDGRVADAFMCSPWEVDDKTSAKLGPQTLIRPAPRRFGHPEGRDGVGRNVERRACWPAMRTIADARSRATVDLHRHLAGDGRLDVRPDRVAAPGARRPAMARLLHRRLPVHRLDLLRRQLRDVALQPGAGRAAEHRL